MRTTLPYSDTRSDQWRARRARLAGCLLCHLHHKHGSPRTGKALWDGQRRGSGGSFAICPQAARCALRRYLTVPHRAPSRLVCSRVDSIDTLKRRVCRWCESYSASGFTRGEWECARCEAAKVNLTLLAVGGRRHRAHLNLRLARRDPTRRICRLACVCADAAYTRPGAHGPSHSPASRTRKEPQVLCAALSTLYRTAVRRPRAWCRTTVHSRRTKVRGQQLL